MPNIPGEMPARNDSPLILRTPIEIERTENKYDFNKNFFELRANLIVFWNAAVS